MNSNVLAEGIAMAATDNTTVTDQTVTASLPTLNNPTPAVMVGRIYARKMRRAIPRRGRETE
jgi:hypothetical protein